MGSGHLRGNWGLGEVGVGVEELEASVSMEGLIYTGAQTVYL